MLIELHMIQNFAPSCLNRDDTNTPKECTFGGVRRARISSQCFKRAIRTSPVFKEAVAVVAQALDAAGYGHDDGGTKTKVLLFLSPGEIAGYAAATGEFYDEIAGQLAAITATAEGKKKPKIKVPAELGKRLKALGSKTTEAADIALFGRMVAETPNLNIDAACQVAHALSTHQAAVEMDFFTAVDDLQPAQETGAGMMGIVQYNSACFYRYAVVDLAQLRANLHGDAQSAREAAVGFCRAAVAAIPTGKQNSMAAHNPPSHVALKVRDGGTPWSLANAFVRPIRLGR